MKKYKRPTVNVPEIFRKVLEKRIEEAGPFLGESPYFMSLFLFDIQARRKHSWTAKIMSLPPKVRDEVFAEIAEEYLSGKKLDRKTWSEHEMDRRVDERIEAMQKAENAAKTHNGHHD